jgi:hypothetical protein
MAGDNLQVERIAASHRVAAEQVKQPSTACTETGSTWRNASRSDIAAVASPALRGLETRRRLVTME